MYENYHDKLSMIGLKLAAPFDNGEKLLTDSMLREMDFDPVNDPSCAEKLANSIAAFNVIVEEIDFKLRTISNGKAGVRNGTYAPNYIATQYGKKIK